MITVVLDAKGAVLGRVAAYGAKQALLGKSVIIVNCSEALLTGRRGSIIDEYINIRQKGGASLNGPFFPKQPERIMKRTIRGMLPYKQERGLLALKRVMCYNKTPAEYEASRKITFKRDLKAKTMNLSDLSREI